MSIFLGSMYIVENSVILECTGEIITLKSVRLCLFLLSYGIERRVYIPLLVEILIIAFLK